MYCSQCGKQISENVKFCKYCGAAVIRPAEKETLIPPQDIPVASHPSVELPDIYGAEQEPSSVAIKQRRKRPYTRIVIPLLLVLLLGEAIAGGIFLYTNKETVDFLSNESMELSDFPANESIESSDGVAASDNEEPNDVKTEPDVYVRTKATRYGADGVEQQYTEYFYDSTWQETGYRTYFKDGTFDEWRFEYEYYDSGTVKSKTLYQNEGQPRQIEYYDESGNLTGSITYDYGEAGNLFWVSERDADHRETGYTQYDVNGEIEFVRMPEYDATGKLIAETWSGQYDDGTAFSFYSSYEYNADGTIAKRAETWAEGNGYSGVSQYTYEYDEQGNIRKEREEFTVNDVQYSIDDSFWYEYEYDESGIIIGWASGEMYEWTNEQQDETGNVIGQITYKKDGSVEIWAADGYILDGQHFILSAEFDDLTAYSEDTYDDTGNLVMSCWYNRSDELVYWMEYEYQKISIAP